MLSSTCGAPGPARPPSKAARLVGGIAFGSNHNVSLVLWMYVIDIGWIDRQTGRQAGRQTDMIDRYDRQI